MAQRQSPEAHGGDESSPPKGGKTAESTPHARRWLGLILAPLLALLAYYLIPAESFDEAGELLGGLSRTGRVVAAVGTLMAVLWVTEALPIAVTALLPIVLFPLLTAGDITVESATAPYAHKLIYLFMGGFLLALAMQQWGLHRRIALHTILLVGTRPIRLVGGFMLASAFLSMWVSNTATVVMMLPIAMSVVELVRRELARSGDPGAPRAGQPFPFAICLMLGTAYASSIGGIGTLIGTPPNAMLAAFLNREYGIEISFVRWMAVGIPLVIVFLPIAWLTLTRIVYPIRMRHIPGGRDLIRRELEEQGPISRPERTVLIVFTLTAAAWITRPLLVKLQWPVGFRPLAGLTDSGIAIGAAALLFALPVDLKSGVSVLSWQQARKLPWGILILFGGGLSLASAVEDTGVAAFIAHGVSGLHALPVAALVLVVIALIVFLTELTSNTATTATFLPILAAVAVGLGLSPMLLIVPMAIAASCAFMMPVATPPNAIVFGSGEITIPQMCKAGLWLNVIGIGLVMLLAYLVIVPVLGIDMP
jgi:sodium-dependent dicarboxylate transporter 2/3/5